MGDGVLYPNGFHHFLILMTSSDKSTQRELGDGCASMARDPAPCDGCLWTNLLALTGFGDGVIRKFASGILLVTFLAVSAETVAQHRGTAMLFLPTPPLFS
jgi:hypothetical protein